MPPTHPPPLLQPLRRLFVQYSKDNGHDGSRISLKELDDLLADLLGGRRLEEEERVMLLKAMNIDAAKATPGKMLTEPRLEAALAELISRRVDFVRTLGDEASKARPEGSPNRRKGARPAGRDPDPPEGNPTRRKGTRPSGREPDPPEGDPSEGTLHPALYTLTSPVASARRSCASPRARTGW